MKKYQSDEINIKGYRDITNFVIELFDSNIYQNN